MPERENSTADYSGAAAADVVWVESGFALGSRPYDHQRGAIAQLGIRMVVSLHEPLPGEPEAWQKLGVHLFSVPTPDWVEISVINFDRVVKVICNSLDADQPVLLHCLAGLNRAPTFAAAVICRRRGMDVDSALAAVRHARPAAKPTPEQEKSLRQWYALRL